jgi:hypothetical protein
MCQRKISPIYLESSGQDKSNEVWLNGFSMRVGYGSPTIMCKSDKICRFYTWYVPDCLFIFGYIMCVKAGFQFKLYVVSKGNNVCENIDLYDK